MFSLFARAAQGAALLPAERAALKLAQGLGTAALVAGAPIVAIALQHPTTADWSGTIHAAIGAAATAILLAAQKWISAKGDASPSSPVPTSAPAVVPAPASSDTSSSGGVL